nr:FAD-dependent oxidoreductase [Terrimicrobiaceae bacterium]
MPSLTHSADCPTDHQSFDLVVVGAGMAGVMAAMAAKTPGNSVLLIEPSNVLGGQGTAGGVAGFCGDTERVNELFAELVERLAEQDLIGPVIHPESPFSDRRDYDLEWCAFFLQEMVVARGIEVLLHSRVIGTESDSGVIRSLTVATAGGLMKVSARFVIDATGACIVPLQAGFPVIHEGANKQLPMSLYFTMWDTGKPVKPILPAGCPHWESENDIPMTSLHFFPTGKIEVKMKVVGFDAADGRSRSEAEIFARRYMHGLIYFLQTKGYRNVPPMNTHVLASVSRAIGVREERRIVGEHVLTEAEVRRGVIFADAVAVNSYHLDFHWPDRMQRGVPDQANPAALPLCGYLDMLDPHHLPLRMMIPKGAKNLLVPGRGASADQMAMSSFRVMATVAQMGFAAGHAARQCLESGADLSAINVPALQAAITAGGQSLDLSAYGRYLRHDIYAEEEVFDGTTDHVPCRAPSIVQISNGRFLAAWAADDGLW